MQFYWRLNITEIYICTWHSVNLQFLRNCIHSLQGALPVQDGKLFQTVHMLYEKCDYSYLATTDYKNTTLVDNLPSSIKFFLHEG